MNDSDLIASFVALAEPYSLREAGAFVGVSHGTVAKWRNGETVAMQPATRRRMQNFVEAGGPAAPEEARSSRPDESERLDAGESPGVQALVMEARAAVLRAEAALVAEKAALVRAEAMREAERAAHQRAVLVTEVEAISPDEARRAAGRLGHTPDAEDVGAGGAAARAVSG